MGETTRGRPAGRVSRESLSRRTRDDRGHNQPGLGLHQHCYSEGPVDERLYRDSYQRELDGNCSGSVGNAVHLRSRAGATQSPRSYFLSDLRWNNYTNNVYLVQRDRASNGDALSIGGVAFAKGLGVHADQYLE